MTARAPRTGSRRHPATYPPKVLDALRFYTRDLTGILVDPMAGSGKAAELARPHVGHRPGLNVLTFDLEPWHAHPGAMVAPGDALHLRRNLARAGIFAPVDGIVVSPGYGNRLRDRLRTDRTADTVLSYAQSLGRNLTPGNGCALPFDDRYRTLHAAAWAEAVAALRPAGRFLLNIKDHHRTRPATKTRPKTVTRERVTAWHITTLLGLGLELTDAERIPLRGFRHGATHARDARDAFELVAVFTKPH